MILDSLANQPVLCSDSPGANSEFAEVGRPYENKICKTKRRFVEIYRARHAIRQISSLTENSGGTERDETGRKTGNGWKGVTTNNLSFSIIALVLAQKATTFHFICSVPEPRPSRPDPDTPFETSNAPRHADSNHPLICSYKRISLLIPRFYHWRHCDSALIADAQE